MGNVNSGRLYNWYAVYLRYQTEKKVNGELCAKGINCYLPIKISKHQWSDRIKAIEEPLLPGYIFVRVSMKEYYEVLLAKGALRYVKFENRPAVIPEKQIQSLKIFVESDHCGIEVTTIRIAKGNFVRVVKGPLKGAVGEVAEVRGKQRLLLRFDKLGYCVQVDLDSNKIKMLKDRICRESFL
jgi:transcription antitermination factor NusG